MERECRRNWAYSVSIVGSTGGFASARIASQAASMVLARVPTLVPPDTLEAITYTSAFATTITSHSHGSLVSSGMHPMSKGLFAKGGCAGPARAMRQEQAATERQECGMRRGGRRSREHSNTRTLEH